MNYNTYLESDNWINKKTEKLNRQSGLRKRCAICSSKENLHIHHLNYKNLYDVNQNDLRILCSSCHKITHELFKSGKIRFKNNNPNSRFAIIKGAVKKELGLSGVNLFSKTISCEKSEKLI